MKYLQLIYNYFMQLPAKILGALKTWHTLPNWKRILMFSTTYLLLLLLLYRVFFYDKDAVNAEAAVKKIIENSTAEEQYNSLYQITHNVDFALNRFAGAVTYNIKSNGYKFNPGWDERNYPFFLCADSLIVLQKYSAKFVVKDIPLKGPITQLPNKSSCQLSFGNGSDFVSWFTDGPLISTALGGKYLSLPDANYMGCNDYGRLWTADDDWQGGLILFDKNDSDRLDTIMSVDSAYDLLLADRGVYILYEGKIYYYECKTASLYQFDSLKEDQRYSYELFENQLLAFGEISKDSVCSITVIDGMQKKIQKKKLKGLIPPSKANRIPIHYVINNSVLSNVISDSLAQLFILKDTSKDILIKWEAKIPLDNKSFVQYFDDYGRIYVVRNFPKDGRRQYSLTFLCKGQVNISDTANIFGNLNYLNLDGDIPIFFFSENELRSLVEFDDIAHFYLIHHVAEEKNGKPIRYKPEVQNILGDIRWPKRRIFTVHVQYNLFILTAFVALLITIYALLLVLVTHNKVSTINDYRPEFLDELPALKHSIHQTESIAANLSSRKEIMLWLGVIFGVGGVVAFFISLQYSVAQTDISMWNAKTVFALLRPTVLLVFIETFTFFFLKQYRIIFNEYKLYHSVYLKLLNYCQALELFEANDPALPEITRDLAKTLLSKEWNLYETATKVAINEFDNNSMQKIIDKLSDISTRLKPPGT